jgi:hypothetical protein
MASSESELSLLNIFEIEDDEQGRVRHLVGFIDAVLAGSVGLVSHAMVGEFQPAEDGSFDPSTFTPNPEFLTAAKQFLNAQAKVSHELLEGATQVPGQRLYLVDPRNQSLEHDDPPPEDVLGWYEVDENGKVVADSFAYNPEHLWFSELSGPSGLLSNRTFYDFLHPVPPANEAGGASFSD